MSKDQSIEQSRLEHHLRANRFVLTAEVTPPVSCSADDLIRKAMQLAGLADAVNVTDGAGVLPNRTCNRPAAPEKFWPTTVTDVPAGPEWTLKSVTLGVRSMTSKSL